MKRRFNFLIYMLIAACLVLTGCGDAAAEQKTLLEPVGSKVDTVTVKKADVCRMNMYNAQIIPLIKELAFEEDGYVYAIYFSAGDDLKEGDVIAELAGRDHAELLRLEEEAELLRDTYARLESSDDAELELMKLSGEDTGLAELEAGHRREQHRLDLQLKEERIEKLRSEDRGMQQLIAPADGKLIALANISEGDYVNGKTAVAGIEVTGEMRITCDYISSGKYAKLEDCYALVHGEKVSLQYVPSDEDRIRKIYSAGGSPVSVFIPEGCGEDVRIGDYAAVFAIEAYRPQVLTVPVNAVFTEVGQSFVYVVEDNIRTRRDIERGITDSINIEVISGLTEGEQVYVRN